MNIDNFNKWLNAENSDAESEEIERTLMADLKEHRLKEQFKQRLKARRERRELIKYGLILAGFVAAIALLIYRVAQPQKIPAPVQSPIEKMEQVNPPIVAQQPVQQTVERKDTGVFVLQKGSIKAADSLLKSNFSVGGNATPIKPTELPPQYSNTFGSPVDTEYLYLTSSEKRPVYFFTSTENEKDTFTILDLSREKLTEIPSKVFPYTQLKTLLLNNNSLKNMDVHIANLKQLEHLDVSKNKLTILPKAMTELPNLMHVNLENNRLMSLPTDIGQLSNLKFLNVRSNKLTALPLSIGQLSRLKELDLGDNNVRTLPNEIGQLSNLTTLNLNSNRLKTLPTDIKEWENLTILNLSSNDIKDFPIAICQLKNLTILDMHNNQLYKLPKEIGQLTQLTRLDLSNNLIFNMPTDVKKLVNLKFLDLHDNPIEYEEIMKIRQWLPNCEVVH